MMRLNVGLACLLVVALGCGDDDAAGGADGGGGGDGGGRDATAATDTGVPVDASANEGCGRDPSGLGTTLDVDGRSRSFVLYVPPGYDPQRAYPLIFAWHGLGGSGQLAQSYFRIEQEAGPDAVIVYPDALPLPDYNGDTGWKLSPSDYDFDFFDALYEHLRGNLCIDASRVFSMGHSFGGFLSNSLGCYRASVLSAIAPVAGGPPYYGACEGPIAAWLTHGTMDTVVSLSDGEAARDTWITANGCAASSASTEPTPCVAYDGCTEDVHWCQHTGGHEWPALAAGAIWQFFSAR